MQHSKRLQCWFLELHPTPAAGCWSLLVTTAHWSSLKQGSFLKAHGALSLLVWPLLPSWACSCGTLLVHLVFAVLLPFLLLMCSPLTHWYPSPVTSVSVIPVPLSTFCWPPEPCGFQPPMPLFLFLLCWCVSPSLWWGIPPDTASVALVLLPLYSLSYLNVFDFFSLKMLSHMEMLLFPC